MLRLLFESGSTEAISTETKSTDRQRPVAVITTEFTSVVFRILHYRNSQLLRVVQNPENHRNESGGG